MKRNDKKVCALLLALALLLSGCSRKQAEPEDSGITLWVVTEQSNSDGVNLQAQIIAERMEETYDNLTINLEILPTKEQEREIRLKQLHAAIMSGNGPDVYLLPVGDTLSSDNSIAPMLREEVLIQVEPLFRDITQAMYNGVFSDISEFYDADEDLGADALKSEVMDAGILNRARYVLPLYFTLPVVLTDTAGWQSLGLSEVSADTRVTALASVVLAQENKELAAYGLQMPNTLSMLPQTFDYAKGEVLLTAQEIADYMYLYQAWYAESCKAAAPVLEEWKNFVRYSEGTEIYESDKESKEAYVNKIGIDFFNQIRTYILYEAYWNTVGFPLYTSRLADVLQTAVIARSAKQEFSMFPLRATDGSVVANITYFGAIGSSCKQRAVAYDFLRQFLTEEFQWDFHRPRVEKNVPWWEQLPEPQNLGCIEDSWPVRTAGSVEYLWDNIQYQAKGIYSTFIGGSRQRSNMFQKPHFVLTDDDLPALSWPIDEVRFPIVLDPEESFEYALSLLNDENGNPTDVDIDALAEQVRLALWWHLAEG